MADVAIAIDWGTAHTRAGFATGNAPSHIIRTAVGVSRNIPPGFTGKTHYCGADALLKRPVLFWKSFAGPNKEMSSEETQHLFHHVFYNELCVAPEEHPIIITCHPQESPARRKSILVQMFEYFMTPLFYLVPDSVCSLAGTGWYTGVIVDIGHRGSRVSVIHHTKLLQDSVQSNDVGGYAVTDYLNSLLEPRGFPTQTHADWDMICDIKEHHCYVARNVATEPILSLKSCQKQGLPGVTEHGACWDVKAERFQAPELLFNPSLYAPYSASLPIQHLIYNSIKTIPESNVTFREILRESFIFTGAGSLFPGLHARLESEVSKFINSVQCPHFEQTSDALRKEPTNLFSRIPVEMVNQTKRYIPDPWDPNILTHPGVRPSPFKDPKNFAWDGASTLGYSASAEAPFWVTKEDYDEIGPDVAKKWL